MLAADDLKPRDWRVLCACFALVSSFSKIWDNVYVDQVAATAGVSRRRTLESLARLDQLGVISWTGSRTRRGSRLDISGLPL